MIALLTGKLAAQTNDSLIIDVNGVGYEVIVSKNTLSQLFIVGSNVTVHVYTHVAEGVLALFGFFSELEKKLFKKLISVSGIGPKLALAILSGLPASGIINAIVSQNLAPLTAISGVGKKTAERMVIELKDKLTDLTEIGLASDTTDHNLPVHLRNEVISALVNLGYLRPQIEKALSSIQQENESFESLLKKTLTLLAKG